MEKFLLLLRVDYARREKMSPEEREASIDAMMKWIESLDRSGNYLTSEPLTNAGSYVSKDYVLSDGPFIESKEAINGYMMIGAENLEQATAITRTCPLVLNDGYIMEVRPVGQKSCRE